MTQQEKVPTAARAQKRAIENTKFQREDLTMRIQMLGRILTKLSTCREGLDPADTEALFVIGMIQIEYCESLYYLDLQGEA